MQIGIVVRDLDAAVRRYVDDYGIGPWEVYQSKPGDVKDWREHGQPVEIAVAAANFDETLAAEAKRGNE